MCGFTGFTGNIVNRAEILRKMADRIIHRGPDMEGYHVSGEGEHDSIALGFRRLSIIDLADGAQPMYNEDGTVVSVFNGEIYNYRELREELLAAGHMFRTNTDSEVLPRNVCLNLKKNSRIAKYIICQEITGLLKI